MSYLKAIKDGFLSGILLSVSLKNIQNFPINFIKNFPSKFSINAIKNISLQTASTVAGFYLIMVKCSQKFLGMRILIKGESSLIRASVGASVSSDYKEIISVPLENARNAEISQSEKYTKFCMKFVSGLISFSLCNMCYNLLSNKHKNIIEYAVVVGTAGWFVLDTYIHFKPRYTQSENKNSNSVYQL